MRNWIFAFFVVLTACVAPAMAGNEREKKMLDGSDELSLGKPLQKRPRGWGGAQPLLPTDSSKSPSPSFTVSADFSQGLGAGQYAIQFSLTNPNDPSLGIQVRAEALITWSVQGIPIVRRVSVFNGMSITGDGESVTIQVIDTSIFPHLGSPVPVPYQVGVTITPGNRGTDTNPPFLYEGFHSLLSSAGLFVPIPQGVGVKSVLVLMSPATGLGSAPILEGQGLIQFVTNTGHVLGQYDPRTFEWVPIPPGTDFINLKTQAAGQTVDFTVFWGIDG